MEDGTDVTALLMAYGFFFFVFPSTNSHAKANCSTNNIYLQLKHDKSTHSNTCTWCTSNKKAIIICSLLHLLRLPQNFALFILICAFFFVLRIFFFIHIRNVIQFFGRKMLLDFSKLLFIFDIYKLIWNSKKRMYTY